MTLHKRPVLWATTMMVLLLMGTCERGFAQNCRELKATYVAYESRCTATGSLKVTASGGSGTYNYMVAGPTNVDYTSSNVITGLAPGTYTLTVKDISSNCTLSVSNVVISGSYVEPRFGLTETDVTCTNGSDGTVTATGLTNGRSPYTYKLVSPSPTGVGTSNSTGIFTGLTPGTYAVQLTDSCGAIQTRQITIQNYTWSISSYSVTLSSCQTYNGQIVLLDSKGNYNTSGSVFSGFTYGVVKAAGDTTWFSNYSFTFNLGDARSIVLVAKDKCGQVQKVSWKNTAIPTIASSVTTSNLTCTTFDVSITGTNLTNPTYCLLTYAGATIPSIPCNNTGIFKNVPYGSYTMQVTNSCYDTVWTNKFSQTKATPSVSASATASNYGCTTFTATVTGQSNLKGPQYCIYTTAGATVPGQICNGTGIFDNLPYGKYVIKVTDTCGASLSVNVTGTKPTRTVNTTLTSGTFTCSSFTVSLGGASGFIQAPTYCLYDSAGNKITCNSSGIFPNVSYAQYCIKATDGCGDTTLTTCQKITRPAVSWGSYTTSNKVCSGYTLTITGQQYIFGGKYCLYDANGNELQCNTTGVFTNVPYGKVCYKETDSCTGGTNTTCVTTTAPVPSVSGVTYSNQVCSGFTAKISSFSNLFGARFCIYNALGVQVGTCNSTGQFDNLAYGSYTIKAYDSCTGTSWSIPVSATKPVASVATDVTISSQTCSTFTAAISSITNLAGATFYLYTSSGNLVTQNTSGKFTSLSYASYCIKVVSSCLDTTIQRCFTATPIAIAATATVTPSCTIASTDLTIKVTAGTANYQVKVYDTVGNLITSTSASSSTSITVSGLPTLATAARYKVVVLGSCGTPDTIMVTATPSQLVKSYAITQMCPSSSYANGSDNLAVTATSNLSGLSVAIVKKNGASASIGYSNKSGNVFTFSNLDAGTYVLSYTFSSCSAPVYDTVVLPAYAFPSLSKSSAYQCDNNSFSVGAAVTGGIGPYTYEIIASNPSTPSIVTSAQSSPIFTINNNTSYDLIRLRAVDACGNAALNDVSVLPLANTIVTSTSNCINTSTTLSTDALANATYTWYKKSTSGTDSTLLASTTNSYTISRITASDTGTYVVKTSVNAGCLTRLSYFHLDGICPIVLPVSVVLQGRQVDGVNRLNWTPAIETDVVSYEIERMDANGTWAVVGTVAAGTAGVSGAYQYDDRTAPAGTNSYRLHVVQQTGAGAFTNVVVLQENGGFGLTVYPNPASKVLNINIKGEVSQHYQMTLYNIVGQAVWTKGVDCASGNYLYQRDASIPTGIYILKVLNSTNGVYATYKIRFD